MPEIKQLKEDIESLKKGKLKEELMKLQDAEKDQLNNALKKAKL